MATSSDDYSAAPWRKKKKKKGEDLQMAPAEPSKPATPEDLKMAPAKSSKPATTDDVKMAPAESLKPAIPDDWQMQRDWATTPKALCKPKKMPKPKPKETEKEIGAVEDSHENDIGKDDIDCDPPPRLLSLAQELKKLDQSAAADDSTPQCSTAAKLSPAGAEHTAGPAVKASALQTNSCAERTGGPAVFGASAWQDDSWWSAWDDPAGQWDPWTLSSWTGLPCQNVPSAAAAPAAPTAPAAPAAPTAPAASAAPAARRRGPSMRGGLSNPNVQWHTLKSQAIQEGWIVHFRKHHPKPPSAREKARASSSAGP